MDNDTAGNQLLPAFASLPMAGSTNNHSQDQEEQLKEVAMGYLATNQKDATTVSVNFEPTAAPTKKGQKFRIRATE